MKNKRRHYHGYRIAPDYRNLVVWTFYEDSKHLLCTTKYTPGKGVKRRQRYEFFCTHLKFYRLRMPDFKDVKSKRSCK